MIIAGLMSGTSADGLDIVIADLALATDDRSTLRASILASTAVRFDPELAEGILQLLRPCDVPLPLVSEVDADLGRFAASAVAELCTEHHITPELIAFHGQTVRHDVKDGRVCATLQLGQPAFIAERLGVPVLSDVRARDVAASGQGAPLVGILDSLLLAGATSTTGMLNLGGIANITVLSPAREPIAFDTGPANALIDELARRISHGRLNYDTDGLLAASGHVNSQLLSDLLQDPYYALPAPKSTGKEHFHGAYLDRYLAAHSGIDEYDAIATVTALTARTIADACHRHQVTSVIAAGGGTRNPELMRHLHNELGPAVGLARTDEALGLPERCKEALLMALIGWLTWHGLDTTEPSLTGACGPRIAGRLSPGTGPLRLPVPLKRRPDRLQLVDGD